MLRIADYSGRGSPFHSLGLVTRAPLLSTTQPRIRVNQILKLGLAFLAFSGVGAAHYFGFAKSIPASISPFITANLIASFLSVFYFNLFFTAISGRVLAAALIYFQHSMVFLYLRIKEGNKTTIARKVSAAIDAEPVLILDFQLPAASLIFYTTYLASHSGSNFDVEEALGIFLLVAIFAVRLPYAKGAINRSKLGKAQRISRLAQNSLINTLSVLVGVLLVTSYLAGSARYSLLWIRHEVNFSTPKFSRNINILMQSGSSILAIEHSGFYQRHVLISQDSVIYELPDIADDNKLFHPFPQ